ncbi:MAG TPA: hypothetical protein PKD64_18935 [Pirellulaceae bacterium]|nr:hypothetical protein [Pirellulaceae bacterium]HMO94266.1 hypothetical protein [Pirellulaceae bacterium]
MKTFADNTGRTWSIAINVGAVKRVRASLDVNLLDAVEGKLIERLVSDPILLCDVIFVLCQQEAETRGITDEQFGQAMAGDAIDAATSALLEELVDFFPSGKRQVLAKALAKLKAFEAKAIELASKRLDDPALEQQLNQALEQLPAVTPGS